MGAICRAFPEGTGVWMDDFMTLFIRLIDICLGGMLSLHSEEFAI